MISCMVNVVTLQACERLCAANGVEMPSPSRQLDNMEFMAAERRLLLTHPMHGPVNLQPDAIIEVRWTTVGCIREVDIFLKRKNQVNQDVSDIFSGITGQHATQRHPDKAVLTDAKGTRMQGVPNTESFNWVVPPSLPEGDYCISVRCSQLGKAASADSCLLCMGARTHDGVDELASVSILRPAALSEHWTRFKGWNRKVWRPSETQKIVWVITGGVTQLDIHLMDGTNKEPLHTCVVAEKVPTELGELQWIVPEVEGKWFYFTIQSSNDNRVCTQSGYVSISKFT